MSISKVVWLVMKRNGANKDLRLMFSRRAAKRHFDYDTLRLRFHRRKMQHMCRLNPFVDVWRVCGEMVARVQTAKKCDCERCEHNGYGHLHYCRRMRMWLRFELPYL